MTASSVEQGYSQIFIVPKMENIENIIAKYKKFAAHTTKNR